jgi:hypothetical protein
VKAALSGFLTVVSLIVAIMVVGYLGSRPSPALTPMPPPLTKTAALKALRRACYHEGGIKSVSSYPGESTAECRSGLVIKLGVSK